MENFPSINNVGWLYDTMAEPEPDIRISAQRALLGYVTRGLRAVSVEKNGDVIRWRCIFASDVAKERQWEELSCAATEVIADYNTNATIDEEYLVVRLRDGEGQQVNEMQHLEHLVFLRHEVYEYPEIRIEGSTDE